MQIKSTYRSIGFLCSAIILACSSKVHSETRSPLARLIYRAKAKKTPADFTGAILKQTQLPNGKIVKEVLATGEWKM